MDSKTDVELIYELSPMQQAMLFHSLLAPGSGVYVIQMSLRLVGRLDLAAFERAWRLLVQRHAILRTAFFWEGLEKPLQVVYREVDLPVQRASWRGIAAAEQAARLADFLVAERERGFDLTAAPLLRLSLFEREPGVHQMVWTVHHLLVDGWSQGLLLRELFAAYAAFSRGEEPKLPPAGRFRDYIGWLQHQDPAKAEAFWRRHLAGFDTPTLLAGGEETPADSTWRDARRRDLRLPAAATAALRETARRHRLTVNTLVQGAWALLLAKESGRGDVAFGTTVAGRPADLPGVEATLGLFINSQPVRVEVPPAARLLDWLRAFQDRLVEMRLYEHAALVDVQRWSALPAGVPLFDHLLVFENVALPPELARPVDELAVVEEAAHDLTNYPLNVIVIPGHEMLLTVRWDAARFAAPRATRLLERLARLLAAMPAAGERVLGDLPLLLDGERHQALVEWNDTGRAYETGVTLHGLIARQAARTPGAVAASAEGVELTYRELAQRADALARHLAALGVRADGRVGVLMERSLEMIVALVGTLQAGAAYVPLDPSWPAERLAALVEGSGARVVLAQEQLQGLLPGRGETVVFLDRPDAVPASPSFDPAPAHEDHLAYVLFTSGSTGLPKGVMISHRGIVNRLLWMQEMYALTPADRVLQKTPFSFDVSVWEFFWPLLTGARLVFAKPEGHKDPAYLAGLIAREKITTLHFVPSMLQAFLEAPGLEALRSVRQVMASGEALSPELVRRFYQRLPHAGLHNLYGPTEASVDVSFWPCAPEPPRSLVPIGRPIANLRLLVMDGDLRPLPLGVAGELLLGGVGLARGYLGRPELTAAAFVPDPSGVEPGGRLYRTGDLTRLLPEGEVEYLGRIDFQVKIRGFRIELGEIEAVLASHPAVRECVVLARRDVPGDPRLVAYAVPSRPVDDPRAAFSAHLRQRLPEYMIPAAFVLLDALPLTTSGKVDRKALPAPERPAGDAVGAVPPADAVEELLAGTWADVLGLPRVGARDDFFALGGHSLLATQVASRVREAFGIEIPLRHLFEAPTVAGLAERIDAQAEALAGGGDLRALLDVLEGLPDAEARARREDPRALRSLAALLAPAPDAAAVPVAPLPRAAGDGGGEFPLSFAQQRLWFIDQLEPQSPGYNIPLPVRLRGDLPFALLTRIAAEIVRRHETLRTTFERRDGGAVQVVHPPAQPKIPLIDLTGLAGLSDRSDRSDPSDPSDALAQARDQARAEAVARDLAQAEAVRPFDLRTGPLLRLTVVRQAAEDHLLLITLHHIIADGWSMRVLLHEVAALFEAFAQGRPSPLPELPFQYADFTLWQRRWLQTGVLDEQLAFWKERLAGAPQVLDLATDRPRPPVQSYRGAAVERTLEPAVAAAVRELCRREDVTPFMVFLAAWAVLLGRQARQDDVLIGTPVAGRHARGTEHLIGFFANTLVLRTAVSGSFRDLLGRVRQASLDAFTHQDLPFERLVEELVPERDLSRAPLFQAMFVLQNAAGGGWRMPGLTIEPVTVAGATAKFDLLLNVADEDGGFAGTLEFSTDLFVAPRMERLLQQLGVLLAGAAADPDRAVEALPLLTAEERERLLAGWNDNAVAWPPVVVHVPVEEQVERTPQAEAVLWAGDGGGAWTYAEVNRRANQLAHHLRALGVGMDDRVAICLERSLDLPVAVLGVLKAGAAYVPIDPDYPAERVAFMLADSHSRALVTTTEVAARLPEPGEGTRVVRLDADREALAARPVANPVGRSRPESLAYVIYTSGSTGWPKGVAMPHGVLANLIHWQSRAASATPGRRTLQYASLSFDASFQEIFSAWWTGGSLVTLPGDTRRDAAALCALMREHRVARLFLPFVGLQQIAEAIEQGAPFPADLAEIITAGEQLRITRQIAAWLERPGVALENQYGPTEGHVVTVLRLTGPPAAWPALPPIGRPLPNVRLFLLDGRLEPVAQGAVGHLYFAGAQVVRGYLDRPELTAVKFIPDPWSPDPGGRLYATGDLARYQEDGEVQFLGRSDQQVKIRGFRVEPGEVETVLNRHPAVREAAVVVRGEGVRMRLVGYWVASGPPLASGELLDALRAELPEHMVPAVLVRLDALPLTPSGKLDRRALPEPADTAVDTGAEAADAPRDPAEELLAGIWGDVLGRGPVGVRDNFFAIGGHSLLATQVISRVRSVLGVELPLRQLFETPTVEGFARAVRAAAERGAAAPPPLAAVPRAGDPPASFAQQRLWLIDQLDPGSPAYDIPLALHLDGALDPDVLERAFAEIVRRHEALRTTFAARGGGVVQVIAPPERAAVRLALVDLAALPGKRTDGTDLADRTDLVAREARGLALQEARFSFDLRRGPLVRLVLVRLGAREHLLLLTFHHVIADGWSLGVLMREVAVLYAAFSQGRPSPLADLPVQYADFALWQRSWLHGEALEAALDAWRRRLAGAPQVLALPTDHPRPAARSFRGAAQTLEIDGATAAELLALCRRQAVTPFMALLGVWAAFLGRFAGQDDLIVGTPIAGRNRREIEDLIGFFVNTLALRIELGAEHPSGPPFLDLLSRVRETTLDAFAHQDLPFERLVEELVPGRDPARTPLFQVLFALQIAGGEPPQIPGVALRPVELAGETSKFDLSLTFTLGGRGLGVSLEYDTALFDGATIERLLAALAAVLAQAVAHPEQRVGDLPWGPVDAERLRMAQAGRPVADAADGLSLVVRLTGALSVETLERAVAEVVRRHAVLRGTSLPEISLLDLSDAPEEAAEEWAAELLAEEVRHPFDLAHGPLLRRGLIRLAEQVHLLTLVVHRSAAAAGSPESLWREIAAVHAAFLAQEGAAAPAATLGTPPRLLPEERERLLHAWNDTALPYPRDLSLAARFAQVAREHPEAPAVLSEAGEVWTYRRLDEASRRLAHRLRALGAGPERPVALCLERSPELILGLLAIVRTGGFYVPLDPAYPDDRLRFLLEDTQADLVLVDAATRGRMAGLAAAVTLVPTEDEPAEAPPADLPVDLPAESLACVLYTSGSTGRPKGVAVTQRAVVRLVCDTNYVHLGPGDRLGQVASISFDAATFEIWGALLTGAAVVVLSRETVLAPHAFAAALAQHRITSMFLTSALFSRMAAAVPEAFEPLRDLLVGGEPVEPGAARRVLAGRPPARLLNGYGPTESTTFAAWHLIREVPPEAALIPVGQPVAQTTLWVLDRDLDLVPPGTEGELCLGGDGLARGYLRRPELTAERFVPHPWGDGERLYRTGDLARRRADGPVELLGRLDDQVKIRGHRIEPGEVEATLAAHPDVRAAAVVARPVAGEVALVAYVVPAPEAADGTTGAALRTWLQERLPEPLVPAHWVLLPALPLSLHGKVDRRALPAPAQDGAAEGAVFVAPSGPLEESLAAIWSEVLRRERIGATDDFFALGGHSMLATQVVTRVREVLGLEMPLRLLFEAPTIRRLAVILQDAPPARERAEPVSAVTPRRALTLRLLALSAEKRELLDAVLGEKNAEASTAAVILPREDREAPIPLSFSQERMWFFHQLDPVSAVYNVYLGVRLTGALRPELLAAAFAGLARRHQVLVTRYEPAGAEDGRPVQIVDPALTPGLPAVDLSGLPAAARSAELERVQAAESGRPFDLRRGPVLRTTLLRVSGGEHVLLLNVHHIAIDGWSLGVLLNELAALYEALAAGEPSPLPAPRLQYADFAVWQRGWMRGEVLDEQRSFWRRELDPPLPLLALPTDRPRQVPQPFRLATENLALPAALTADLHALGAGRGASLFMVLLSGLAAVLHRTGGDERLLVGTPVAGRNRRELEGLVGVFLNTLVLRVDLEGDPGFGPLLQATARRALDAFAHQDLPLETLLQELRLDGAGAAGARGPFQVMLLVQNLRHWEIEVPGLTLTGLTAEREVDLGTTVFELGLTVEEHGGALQAALSYNAALFDAATLRRLLGHLATLLAGAVADPGTRLSELPLLTAAEQAEVSAWNPPSPLSLPPGAASIPALFAAQAARTPGAEAVRQAGRSLTYAELERTSRALAGRLRKLGVGPEVPVAVFLERSPELIAALLGVLRAGGAYAPLDPAFPPERRAWILDDLRPGVVITDATLAGQLAWEGPVLRVDEGEDAAAPDLPPVAVPGQAAYVIYTSGSTGRPKGVTVPHGAFAAFVAAARDLYGISAADRVLQLASVGFDASIEEIYPCLTAGGTLVLRTDEMAATLAGFLQGCADQGVTVLDLPTAFWHELVTSPDLDERGLPESVRLVILGGERPLPERVAAWLRRIDPRVRLVNTYGPTEATVVATAAALSLDVELDLWREVSMGRPLPGTQAHVADRGLRPVPVGVPGELVLGGLGVARGYLGRPDLTAERFVPDPFAGYGGGLPGARLYRTGDLARRRDDGTLEFAGRVDQQVKIRGFRVEPGEIETVLATHPQIGECAVLARADGPRAGDLRLVAYIVPTAGARPNTADLRTWLEGRLPAWMIPAAFVSLPALPRTPNGKLDRRALPAPDGAQLDTGRPHVAPRTEFEEIIAEIWSEALGVEHLSVFDSFFELGGSSLLLLQIMRRLRDAFDLEVPLRAVFEERTVAALAKKVEELLIEEIKKTG